MALRCIGSLFHNVGPITLNDLAAKVAFLARGSTKVGCSADDDLVTRTDSLIEIKDDKYAGAES